MYKLPTQYLSEVSTDKLNYHSYGNFYNMIFSSLYALNDRKSIRVLEIGVSKNGIGSGHAYSRMPYVEKFVGVDIKGLQTPFDNGGTFILADAYDSLGFSSVSKHGPFHLIIDDSTHKDREFRLFFKMYRALLADPGYMVYEDINIHEIENRSLIAINELDIDIQIITNPRSLHGLINDWLFIHTNIANK